jgi:hypothetical protein
MIRVRLCKDRLATRQPAPPISVGELAERRVRSRDASVAGNWHLGVEGP